MSLNRLWSGTPQAGVQQQRQLCFLPDQGKPMRQKFSVSHLPHELNCLRANISPDRSISLPFVETSCLFKVSHCLLKCLFASAFRIISF